MSDNEGEREGWNMAQATLQRINNILIQCSIASQSNQLDDWYGCLLDLRRNLAGFIEEKDYEKAENLIKELPSQIVWYRPDGKLNKETFPLIYTKLDEIQITFNRAMKAKGLLMPKTIDVGKAVLG